MMMLHWYVIHSKPQKEFFLQDQLTLRNLESYCPTMQIQRINQRTRRFRPYFPGYLFTHLDLDETNVSIFRWIPGAIGLVDFGGEPASVPDTLLNTIRNRVDQINEECAEPLLKRLKPGDEVIIHSGPFAGYEAIFCAELQDNERVQVLLQLLQDHTVRLDLPVSQIELTKPDRC
jgi:transcription elongation factor/antiterminator RfaH